MNEKLVHLASQYDRYKKSIAELEGETQHSSIHTRTFLDIRYVLDYALAGIRAEESDDQLSAKKHYDDASRHLDRYALDAFDLIAAKSLNEAREQIESASVFSRRGIAKAYYEESMSHFSAGKELFEDSVSAFNEGRTSRTEDIEQSLTRFRQAAYTARQVRFSVDSAPTTEKFMLWWAIIIGLLTLINAIYLIINILT